MPGKSGFDFSGSSQGFNVLAEYLFGKNVASEKMEMTTPVITQKAQPNGEQMEMTTPVITKQARRGGSDEPFAWDSREFLRKLCIGQIVTFKLDYIVPSIGREFGSVFLGEKNVVVDVVSAGWAKAPSASANSIRNLPPSDVGDPSNIDALGLLAANKGVPMQAVVENVRDGSTVRVYLLPEFQFVQVLVAGIQSPSMGRRGTVVASAESEIAKAESNGEKYAEKQPPVTAAQKLFASTSLSNEVTPSPLGKEAKHFTEIHVLNREVRIVLEGVDKYNNLVASLYYPDGDSAKDLALGLVENGLAKYMDWSANLMEEDAKRKLKNAELKAKKARLMMWTNFVPPASDSKALHDQNFKGKVVEIVSGAARRN